MVVATEPPRRVTRQRSFGSMAPCVWWRGLGPKERAAGRHGTVRRSVKRATGVKSTAAIPPWVVRARSRLRRNRSGVRGAMRRQRRDMEWLDSPSFATTIACTTRCAARVHDTRKRMLDVAELATAAPADWDAEADNWCRCALNCLNGTRARKAAPRRTTGACSRFASDAARAWPAWITRCAPVSARTSGSRWWRAASPTAARRFRASCATCSR